MTRHATAADFTLGSGGVFQKLAVYFPSMDYVDYVREDGIKVYERVDQFLTVIWNENNDMVGFKLKGIKNYFLRKLQPALSLQDDDFVWVSELFAALATEIGNDLFENGVRQDEKRAAYKRAAKIAREDSVKFVAPELMAA